MTNIWNKMNLDEKEEYKRFLKIFGSLSGLFKDNKEGINATKPYLYYRNHEHLYSKVFDVEDLTRKDSAFDEIGRASCRERVEMLVVAGAVKRKKRIDDVRCIDG